MQTLPIQTIEEILRPWLKSLGYYKIEVLTKSDDAKPYLISADGDKRRILLMVIASKSPQKPTKLSPTALKEIKDMAAEKEREPWSAVFKVNAKAELEDSIEWANLQTT